VWFGSPLAGFCVLALVVGFIAPLSSTPAQAQRERLSVIGSTTMIADVVGQVAGDAADVVSLMSFGVDPHAFTPSAQDIVALDEADLVFVNGVSLEENLLPVLEEAAGDRIATISECVAILPFGLAGDHEHDAETEAGGVHESDPRSLTGQCAAHYAELQALGIAFEDEHPAEAGHIEALGYLYELNCEPGHEEESAAEGEHVHEAGSCDPHVWTDIRNVMLWTLMARDTLSAADPANAATYAANAQAYLAQLQALDGEVSVLLQTLPQEARVLVTNHETLGYLAARYRFEVVGTVIPGGGTAAEPSAEEIVALIETIQDYNVRAIFSENTVSDALAQQLADEAGVTVYQLYSDSLTGADGDASSYLDYMRFNVTTIVQALSGR
jgi:ABC-type Zn uptake system ZnuABC Zn-binding protein ZnuA